MARLKSKARVPQFATLATTALVLGTAGWTFAAPVPLVQYNFNEGAGTTAANSGSVSDPNTAMTLSNGAVFTASGTGVSGLAGDSALSVSTATNTTAIANQGADVNAIDGLHSFTLQGWYQVGKNTKPGGQITVNSSSGAGFGARFKTGAPQGSIVLSLNGPDVATSNAYPAGTATAGSGWVFFAIAYDGTQATNNLTFYVGSTSGPVTVLGTPFSIATGILNNDTGTFSLGNNATFSFNGMFDDVRIFGSTTDASGALTSAQLEAIRQSDVASSVPEPASLGLLTLGGLALVRRKRR